MGKIDGSVRRPPPSPLVVCGTQDFPTHGSWPPFDGRLSDCRLQQCTLSRTSVLCCSVFVIRFAIDPLYNRAIGTNGRMQEERRLNNDRLTGGVVVANGLYNWSGCQVGDINLCHLAISREGEV